MNKKLDWIDAFQTDEKYLSELKQFAKVMAMDNKARNEIKRFIHEAKLSGLVKDVIGVQEEVKVKIKRLVDNAVTPKYAKAGDAGMDLTATAMEYDGKLRCFVYHTGLAIEIPTGYVGLIYPRSSNRKTDAYMTNHVGVIDSGYRGEVLVCFKNRDESITRPPYMPGDRIAQLMIVPYPKVTFEEVEELSESERGEGGHGSTGK